MSDELTKAAELGFNDLIKLVIGAKAYKHGDLEGAARGAISGGNIETLRLLLEHDTTQEIDARALLSTAAFWGKTEVMQFLLGEFFYCKDELKTALLLASLNGEITTLEILLAHTDYPASVLAEILEYTLQYTIVRCNRAARLIIKHIERKTKND